MRPREAPRRRRNLDPDATATGRALAVVIGFAVVSIVAVVLAFTLRGRPPTAAGNASPATLAAAPARPAPAPDAAALVRLVHDGERSRLAAALPALAPGVIDGIAAGMTPLMQASTQGDLETVELLLAHGADPNARGGNQRTALQYAAERNHLDVARALLDGGAAIDGYDDTRLTPLVMAADRNYTELALFLLERGADVDIAHVQGWTALIDAARHGNRKLVRALVAAGADTDARLPGGQTARDLAAANGHDAVVRLLDQRARRLASAAKLQDTPGAPATRTAEAAAAAGPSASSAAALPPQLAALLLAGRYAPRTGDALDDSRAVRLVAVDDGLRWSAGDGVFWRLALTGDPARLAVGADCPWYDAGYREVVVEWDGAGKVRRVRGPHDEWFERMGE